MAWTKEKRSEYMKRYRQENREHIKAYRRNYYLKSLWGDSIKINKDGRKK